MPPHASSTLFQDEEKQSQSIVGFNVLSDGTLIKIHSGQTIEIIKGDHTSWIKTPLIPFVPESVVSIYDADYLQSIRIMELNKERVVVIYNIGYKVSYIVMIDHVRAIQLGTIQLNENVRNPSVLADGSLLISNNFSSQKIILHKDKLVKSPAGQNFPINDFNVHHYLLKPDQTGYLHYTNKWLASVDYLDKDFKRTQTLRICNEVYDGSRVHGLPTKISKTHDCVILKSSHLVVLSSCENRYLSTVAIKDSKDTYYLHSIKQDLSTIKTISLNKKYYPIRLIPLDEAHFAIMLASEKLQLYVVKIYNLRLECINRFELKQREYLLAPTPDGEIAVCDEKGFITLHRVLPSKEALMTATTSVLLSSDKKPPLLIKDIVPIIAEYAGFFSSKTLPKPIYDEEIVHKSVNKSLRQRIFS